MEDNLQQNQVNDIHEPESYRQNGNLRISEEVVSTIAGMTTRDIKGVAGLSLRPSISEVSFGGLLNKRLLGKAVRLEMREGEAVIDIAVNLFYGSKIPEVAEQIQTRVRDAVQNMTGIMVSKVNVQVAGMVVSSQEDEHID